MLRREFLWKAGTAGAAFATGCSSKRSGREPAKVDKGREAKRKKEGRRLRAMRRIKDGDVLQRFNSLPEAEQKDVISHLEKFVLSETARGPVAQDFCTKVNVPEKKDTSMPEGTYLYSIYTRTITYSPQSNSFQIGRYLQGRPRLFGTAHEKMHIVQNSSSRWDSFEQFFTKYFEAPKIGARETTHHVSRAMVVEFAERFMNNPSATPAEAFQGFKAMWDDYNSKLHERKAIMEVQAHLMFEPYIKSDDLYKNMMQSSIYRRDLARLTRKQFDDIFRSTIKLSDLLDPFSAAQFAGRKGDSISDYVEAVDGLESKKGVRDAYKKGMTKQNAFLREVHSIILEAVDYIDVKYKATHTR